MKIKIMQNKKIFAEHCSCKLLVQETSTDFMLRVGKSYVPFTCEFPMAMHFMLIFQNVAVV